jgi:hypothetical protein
MYWLSVQPLLSKHDDECGKQGDQKFRVNETGDDGDLAQRAFLNRWNSGGLTGMAD